MGEEAFDREICSAWQAAEKDLGIRVTAPFVLRLDDNEVAFEALVSDFGGPIGTIALTAGTAHFRPALKQLGYFVSQLFPSYRMYSREHFIATLNDWQWFGPPDEVPPWYTGKPWA
jgi:hypothetical protein